MTLRESAEKLVAEAFSRATKGSFNYESALSAVLAGMRMVLQGTPHLEMVYVIDVHDRKGTTALEAVLPDTDHAKEECARLGGACRLREVE